jgi:hypothetical protein
MFPCPIHVSHPLLVIQRIGIDWLQMCHIFWVTLRSAQLSQTVRVVSGLLQGLCSFYFAGLPLCELVMNSVLIPRVDATVYQGRDK